MANEPRDARIAVKWLLRIEAERERQPSNELRQRPDTIAAALPWWQLALKLGGCRHGRHYARQIRDQAIAEGLVIDTGCVDTPRSQRRYKQQGESISWWPIYIIAAEFKRSKKDWLGHHTYWPPRVSRRDLASLCSDRVRQLLKQAWDPAYGSVQAAFKETGPP